jgi:glycosyltransferase involved in cell wall biosynthesis
LSKIYFIVPYPFSEAPSQRFRFEQYHDVLLENGFTFKFSSFWNQEAWKILYKNGFLIRKLLFFIAGFLRRFLDVFVVIKYDLVFIHREATPIGPPFFEFIIAKILRKKIIYDFDDAIWMKDSNSSFSMRDMLKCYWKVSLICKWSYKVSVGNQYLKEYAFKFNNNVILNPTTVNVGQNQITFSDSKKLTIGWTGTHSTLKYLEFIFPIFEKLNQKYEFEFLIISNNPSKYTSHQFIKNIHWQKDTEIQDLLKIDIGIMPLFYEEWVKGKCGFKILQFMALAIPVIASPFGVNSKIIKPDFNGYLAHNEKEWSQYLEQLLNDHLLRKKIGINGKNFVVQSFSQSSNTYNFLKIFSV